VPTANDIKTFPFTKDHMEFFKKEMNEAGGFDELMFQKKALQRRSGMKYIMKFKNIEKYKSKFLTDTYESLRPMYDTEIPYIFWNALHEVILKEYGEFV
jgi:hypothetical protein